MSKVNFVKFISFTAILLLFISACKDKKITGPDTPNPGAYTLELRSDDTLHYFVNNENIITIRVFQGTTMPTDVIIKFETESGIGFIDDNNQTMRAQSDTVSHPCGANPCMDYHCNDTTVTKDAVYAYAVVSNDTVATASIGFFLEH